MKITKLALLVCSNVDNDITIEYEHRAEDQFGDCA